MSGPETNAPYQAESETSSGNAVNRESWKSEKDLSQMSSDERLEWLRGSDPKEDKWSSSSLSAFEVPDAPVDDSKSAKSDEVQSGDVRTVENFPDERKASGEGEDSAAKPAEGTDEWAKHHEKSIKALPAKLIKELSSELGEIQEASNRLRISSGLSEFVVHILADLENPSAVVKNIVRNQALISALENQRPEVIIDVLRDIDKKMAPSHTPQVKVTRAPAPAREVGGRGSTSGHFERRPIERLFRAHEEVSDGRDKS
jgi:hypothetical protein